jgi:hypothetical protein
MFSYNSGFSVKAINLKYRNQKESNPLVLGIRSF